jgi:hypothetical protein
LLAVLSPLLLLLLLGVWTWAQLSFFSLCQLLLWTAASVQPQADPLHQHLPSSSHQVLYLLLYLLLLLLDHQHAAVQPCPSQLVPSS